MCPNFRSFFLGSFPKDLHRNLDPSNPGFKGLTTVNCVSNKEGSIQSSRKFLKNILQQKTVVAGKNLPYDIMTYDVKTYDVIPYGTLTYDVMPSTS